MGEQKKTTMDKICFIVCLFVLLAVSTANSEKETNSQNLVPWMPRNKTLDWDWHLKRLKNQTQAVNDGVKSIVKIAVKELMPLALKYNNGDFISTKCSASFLKVISGLMSVKSWAVEMVDATSKPPSGILEGTLSDFGAFDQCLEIELPSKKGGGLEFRGQYCSIEARPILPPPTNSFSMAQEFDVPPLDTLASYLMKKGGAFHYLQFRLGVCVPSTCTIDDIRRIAVEVGEYIEMDVRIPKCYVKEETVFKPVHIAVISVLCLLSVLCISGSFLEYNAMKSPMENKDLSVGREFLMCFSFISNYQRLISSSQGSENLKVLHGFRAFSIAWVMLGHNCVWMSFQLLRRPAVIPGIFRQLHFGVILNAWLAVEPFFFLSGFLTSYTILQLLPAVNGKFNVPVYILYRYIRLTPSLLLTIGLAFFMPLIASGPFWYEFMDDELNSCTTNWWASLLYISNWYGMKQICMHPTWYLSADFQLYVVSIIILIALLRCPKVGFFLMFVIVIVCNAGVAVLTYIKDLPPIVLISSGNNPKILETIDAVHMATFAHAGPYYIGMAMGYWIAKNKNIKINRVTYISGWCIAIFLSTVSLYGAHKWNIGEGHGPILTALFAGLHRTLFITGVAWVVFICITGHGGVVNRMLSSSMLAPAGRLTYMVYLLHSLVFWVRKASVRERMFISHYNLAYEFIGNFSLTLLLAIPFYLLLEAPLSNLERLIFAKLRPRKKRDTCQGENGENGHLSRNVAIASKNTRKAFENGSYSNSVVLTSVTNHCASDSATSFATIPRISDPQTENEQLPQKH